MSDTETEAMRLDESSDSSSNAVQNGSSQKFNGGSGQERLLYDGKEGGIVNEVGQYPNRPGQQDCIYYLRTGLCGYGTNCRYNHPNYVAQDAIYGFGGELPERDGVPDCAFFLKTGTCKYGSSCKYNHPRDKNGAGPVSFNILGLPLRPEEVHCKYYLQTGQCKFGPACKYHHPQRTVPGLAFPVNGNMPFGSAKSSNLPIRAFPALPIPMPTPTYIYDSPMHTPQAFMPMAVSPLHNYFPQQPWNTLTGNIRHTSSTSVYGSSPSYSSNSKSLCESGSNGKVQQHLPFLTHYPEIPDRPECHNLANYGSCKYGLDCKFNHPTERMGQMLPRPLIPLAYPGQPLCSSFIAYGVCRSGPFCKFCHQGVGYPMNYGLIPLSPHLPMPIFDEPLFGRKSSTVVISSKISSPSKSTKDLDGVNNPNVIAEKTQHSDTNGHQECKTVNTQHSENTGQKKPEEDAAGTPGDSSPLSSPKQQD